MRRWWLLGKAAEKGVAYDSFYQAIDYIYEGSLVIIFKNFVILKILQYPSAWSCRTSRSTQAIRFYE